MDLASVAQTHYPFLPVRAVLWDKFPLADQLAAVTVPVTIVYGTEDSIVPPEHSRLVAESAATLQRLVAIAGADHNDRILLDGDPLIDAVVELADRVDKAS